LFEHVHSIFVFVKTNTKSFRDSNFNVTKSIFDLFLVIWEIYKAECVAPESWIWTHAVRLGVEKMTDKKLADKVATVLTELCVVKEPKIVCSSILQNLDLVKAPPAHQNVLLWFNSFIADFGANTLGKELRIVTLWVLMVSLFRDIK